MLVPQLLLETLEDLSDHDFEKFKWFLGLEILRGCNKIPRCDRESPHRHLIVSKMVETYGEETAVKMTVTILRLMNHNNSAEQLERTHREGAAAQERVSRPSVPSSSASGPPTDGAAGAQLRDDFRGAQAPNQAHRCDLFMGSLGGLGNDINGFVNDLLDKNLGGSFTDTFGRNVNNNNPSFVAGNTGGDVGGGGDIHSIITHLEGEVGRMFGGNVFTGNINGNLQSNFSGIVKGDVSGKVGDNFRGFIRGSVRGNLGSNFCGVVEGDVCGKIGCNFRGVVTGNVGGGVGSNFSGILMGSVRGKVGCNFQSVAEGNVADYIRSIFMRGW